jgi:hypothetical protein
LRIRQELVCADIIAAGYCGCDLRIPQRDLGVFYPSKIKLRRGWPGRLEGDRRPDRRWPGERPREQGPVCHSRPIRRTAR